MKTRPWLFAGAFLGLLVTGVTVSQWSRWAVVAVSALAVLGWLLSMRCSHRYATLLPPVRDGGPERDHARWYCDRCGKTWDSGLESSTRPRVIYEGYDEHKAVRASARADALDKQRRRLATKRASGSRQRTVKPAPVAAGRRGPRPVEAVLDHAVGFSDLDSARPFAAMRRARE